MVTTAREPNSAYLTWFSFKIGSIILKSKLSKLHVLYHLTQKFEGGEDLVIVILVSLSVR